MAQAFPPHDAAQLDRRTLLAVLAGGVGIAGGPAFPTMAALIAPDDARLKTANITWPDAAGRTMHGYIALPAKARGRQPAVIVVPGDRGLDDHSRDVVRRTALEGFVAVAPNLLSQSALARRDDADTRGAIARIDPQRTAADITATIAWLAGNRYGTGKVALVGAGWGGGVIVRTLLAGAQPAAAVVYDAEAIDPVPIGTPPAGVPLLFHFAARQEGETGLQDWARGLTAKGLPVTVDTYPDVQPGFDDDTLPARYDPTAAALAWRRTADFLRAHLR